MTPSGRHIFLQGLAAATLALGGLAQAQGQASWPTAGKPISIVSAYPAGGSSDVLGRAIGEKMSAKLGVPVIVENKAGGGGQIAAAHLKQQPADGHTLWLGDVGPFATNMHVYARLSYDMGKEFTPVAKLVNVPVFLVVSAKSPFKKLDDLIQASRQNANGLSYGSQGAGLGGHIYGELFKREVGGRLNHIPYRGSIPGLADLMGGQIDLMHDNALTSGPLVKDGKLRALAVRATARMPQFPDVPTMPDLGMANLNHVLWFGVVVKAGTPAAVVRRLSEELSAAMRDPAVSKRFTDMGLEISLLGPQEFGSFLVSEQDKWGRIIRDTGIRLEE